MDNDVHIVESIIFLSITFVLYLVPSVIAYAHNHQNRLPILITNVTLGWTLVGWIVALVWSLTKIK